MTNNNNKCFCLFHFILIHILLSNSKQNRNIHDTSLPQCIKSPVAGTKHPSWFPFQPIMDLFQAATAVQGAGFLAIFLLLSFHLLTASQWGSSLMWLNFGRQFVVYLFHNTINAPNFIFLMKFGALMVLWINKTTTSKFVFL